MLQRVTSASVSVDGAVVGSIGSGLVALIGVTHDDTADAARALAEKVSHLRILRDEQSVLTARSAVLAISQFTLYADTRKGRRPSWNAAAPGAVAGPIYATFCARLRELGIEVAEGRFGADMRPTPATLVVDSS